MGLFNFLVAVTGVLGLASAATNPMTAKTMSSYNAECNKFVGSIPACGLGVIISAGTGQFGCAGPVDYDCQCAQFEALQSAIFTPVLNSCGPTTALDVLSGAQQLCDCVSYNATVPPTAQITRTTAQINPNGNKLCVNYGLAIPHCGTAVLQSIASSKYGCGNFDFQCQCAQISALQISASTPVISACGTTTALQVLSVAAQLCSCITANNQGLPPASGTIPSAATVPTATLYAGANKNAPEIVRGAASILSIFAGFAAMF